VVEAGAAAPVTSLVTPPAGSGRRTANAGFGRRLAALLLDAFVTGLLLAPALFAVGAGPTETKSCRVESGQVVVGSDRPDNALCTSPTAGTWALFGLLAVAALAVSLVAAARLEGRRGQTLGAQAAGIRVVDADTGEPIGPARAVGRWFARLVSALACTIGFLWVLVDPQRQTWHDKLTRSVVVRA
jgi:uncharacterized RDD family membrane protein YckC